MRQWKCKSCNATYPDTQPDGTLYFHACAPMPPDAQGNQAEHPNKRDENITVDGKGRATGIKAAGAGVVPVGPTLLTQPAWLSQVQAAAAAVAAGG